MMTNPRSQINLTHVIVLNEELQVILQRRRVREVRRLFPLESRAIPLRPRPNHHEKPLAGNTLAQDLGGQDQGIAAKTHHTADETNEETCKTLSNFAEIYDVGNC